jgi:hypothetical protein
MAKAETAKDKAVEAVAEAKSLMEFLAKLFTGGLSALFGVFGKTITDIHADNTTRYRNENDAGNQLATTTADASVKSAQIRADVQKSQGTWGPFGLAGFLISMAFAFHVLMIVMDSTSWHLVPDHEILHHPVAAMAGARCWIVEDCDAAGQVRGHRARNLAGAVLRGAAVCGACDRIQSISKIAGRQGVGSTLTALTRARR